MKNSIILSLALLVFSISTFGLSAQSQETNEKKELSFIEELDAGFIENISSKAIIEGFTASWNLDYELFQQLKENGYTLSIKYNTKIGAKRHEKGYENSDWTTIKGIDLHETSYTINNLAGKNPLVFRLVSLIEDKKSWFKKKQAK